MPKMRISRWMRLRLNLQRDGHATAAEKWATQVHLVEPPEQMQILRVLRPRPVVEGRARHAEQFALLLNTNFTSSWQICL